MRKFFGVLKLVSISVLAFSLLTACQSKESAKSKEASDSKVLKVAMECSYAPYNWTQTDDKNGALPIQGSSEFAYGYDVMMAKHIGQELGYDIQIVKLDWDALVPAVQSGSVD